MAPNPKQLAAEYATNYVENHMVVGLGTGTTAYFAIIKLAELVADGLAVRCIPTSDSSAKLARERGIPLTSFAEVDHVDLTIDGADQVERGTFHLIKGWGGALLREKIVASATDRMVVIVDETKLVDRLGGGGPLPVEIVSFGWQTVVDRLAALGCAPRLRLAGEEPFTTDGGNYIADCVIMEMTDPAALEAQLATIVGVIECGLFVGLASEVIVGRPGGVEVMEK